MRVRAARADEAPELSGLALRSKAHWGYEAEFMAACRDELTLPAAEIAARRTTVAEIDGRVAGVATLDGDAPSGALGMLFVDPVFIGQGVGRTLFRHMVATAAGHGFTTLTVDADPNAEAFYLAMGAVRIGGTPSGSIPGRILPLLTVTI